MEADEKVNERRWLRTLAVFCIGLFCISSWLAWMCFRQSIEAAFADEQCSIFAEMQAKALTESSPAAAKMLLPIIEYYPSGTKQRPGTRLDSVVERARFMAIARIIDHLRQITGEDLGDRPEPWINRYAVGSH